VRARVSLHRVRQFSGWASRSRVGVGAGLVREGWALAAVALEGRGVLIGTRCLRPRVMLSGSALASSPCVRSACPSGEARGSTETTSVVRPRSLNSTGVTTMSKSDLNLSNH